MPKPLRRRRRRRPDERIGVLHLIHDIGPGFGGAEQVAYDLVRALDPRRFRRYVCVTRAAPDATREVSARTRRELESAGIEVLSLDRTSSRDVLPWWRLYRLLRSGKVDLVHAHMFRANVPGVLLGRAAGVPAIIAHEHSGFSRGRVARAVLEPTVVGRLSHRVLAPSEADRSRLAKKGYPARVLKTLPNGITPSRPGSGARARGALGISPSAPVVLAMGRLHPQKAFEVLIDAAAMLRPRFPGLRVLIAGEGPDRPLYERRIADLELGRVVRLLGFREDVADLIGAADVAVLCSRFEGTPLALIEYMAAAKPIVATPVGGVPELLDEGVHGTLVAPDDPGQLASALRRLLEDPELARRLGAAAQARQRRRLSLDSMVDELQALYEATYWSAVGGTGRRATPPAR